MHCSTELPACPDIDVLKDAISPGYLALLCINTVYLSSSGNEEQRVGRFYGYASGHFLIIKGCRPVSGVTYLESYDPNTWHAAYPDRSPQGRNRHYSADDSGAAIRNWRPYAVLIPPAGGPGGAVPIFALKTKVRLDEGYAIQVPQMPERVPAHSWLGTTRQQLRNHPGTTC